MIVDPPGGTVAEPGREARALAAGEKVGKYRLDRVIGAGGMGIVWAAFDPDLERAVAIKLLRAGGGEATLRSRLLREARAMARLKHPNVLTVYEVGTDHDRDYIAMELVDGDSLDLWLAGRPPTEQVMAALLAAGQGLAAAHEAGLVHRDFKPHNVLRSRGGHVYVTDFGLARGNIEEGVEVEQVRVAALPDLASVRRAIDSLLDSPLTQTGVLIGTPAYMAPEQFAGRVPDARSDQFAFCVTAWEALTGARPFGGQTLPELERAAAAGVRANESQLPGPVREVLARGLDPAPASRFPDLPSLLRALGEAAAMPAARPRVRRRRWKVVAIPAAGLLAVAIALSVVSNRHHSSALGECGDPDEAFGDAWSAERRAAVMKAHSGGDAIGAVVLLDGFRTKWMRSYRDACTAPDTAENKARLSCLVGVRDKIAAITAEIARPGSAISMGDLGVLAYTGGQCDPEGDDNDFIPPIQVFPTPPTPPAPRPPGP